MQSRVAYAAVYHVLVLVWPRHLDWELRAQRLENNEGLLRFYVGAHLHLKGPSLTSMRLGN